MWPSTSPMHSDVDLLILTRDRISDADRQQLIDETYPFFLECGRQISPIARWDGNDQSDLALRRQIEADGRLPCG